MRVLGSTRSVAAAAAICWLYACGGPSSGLPVSAPATARRVLVGRPAQTDEMIQHVVIIIQENRTVDNLFQGFPGADTQSYGYNSENQQIDLQQVGLKTSWDLGHNSQSFFAACNGQGSYPGTDCQMNGFNNEQVDCGHHGQPSCPNANPPYSYVPPSETAPYFSMGEQYVFADEMFASNFDESSFVSHQYIIAAQADSSVNFPLSLWGCRGGSGDTIDTVNSYRQIGNPIPACWNIETLGDELDEAGLSWKYYTSKTNGSGGEWSAYQAIEHIYDGPDWKADVITPQTVFFSDISNGTLPVVSWITPTCANSDHAGCNSDTGPSWVASLVNAIGESQYWNSTVIFIFWDDPGGWYDHVAPEMLDYDGLGFRVPLLIVSAYAKQGFVSHTQFEHGSILKFIEDRFGLPRLSASDTRATSPEDCCFNWTQQPRTFTPIQSSYKKNYFLDQPADLRPPDSE